MLAPFTGPPQPASPPSPAPPACKAALIGRQTSDEADDLPPRPDSLREPPDIRTVLAPYLPHSSQSTHALDCRFQTLPPSACTCKTACVVRGRQEPSELTVPRLAGESIEPIKLHIYKVSSYVPRVDTCLVRLTARLAGACTFWRRRHHHRSGQAGNPVSSCSTTHTSCIGRVDDTENACSYYLRFPKHFFSSRWELSLRRGGPEGPEIAQIHKGGASWKDSFEIRWT